MFHETSLGIVLGFLAGLPLYFFIPNMKVEFEYDIFYNYILPPIVFAAGYNVKKKEFFKNFQYILAFGVFGTIVIFVMQSVATYKYDSWYGWNVYTPEG